MTTPALTERRKADRAKMAAQVAELAAEHGIAARIVSGEHQRPRAMFVNLEGPHGLRLTVAFDGASQQSRPDTYVLSWHGVGDGWRLNPAAFPRANMHHGRKATDIVYGFAGLLALLRRRFEAISDGSAFILDVTDAFLTGRVAEYRRSGFGRSLLEYLGMTPEEYGDWFTTGVVPARVQRTWQRTGQPGGSR